MGPPALALGPSRLPETEATGEAGPLEREEARERREMVVHHLPVPLGNLLG